MALVNRSILLDITPGAIPQIVNVSEYDQNRAYTVNLVDEGGVYSIPSGTTAKVEGTIGGNPFSVNCTVNGDAISFELDESMTAAAGDAWCKIKLAKDSKPIQTCAFILRCDRAGVEADTVIGAQGFEEQIQDAVQAIIDRSGISVVLSQQDKQDIASMVGSGFVSPESFGAIGDGTHDDTEALIECFEHANAIKMPVAWHDKTIYLKTATAQNCPVINTDVDFSGCTILMNSNNQGEAILKIGDDPVSFSASGVDATNFETVFSAYPNSVITVDSNMSLGQRQGDPTTPYFHKQTFLTNDYGVIQPFNLYTPISSVRSCYAVDRYAEPITVRLGTIVADSVNYPAEILVQRSNVTVCDTAIEPRNITSVSWANGLFTARYGFNIKFRNIHGNNIQAHSGATVTAYLFDAYSCYGLSFERLSFIKNWGGVATHFCTDVTMRDCDCGRMDYHYGVYGDNLVDNCRFFGFPAQISVGYGDGKVTVRDSAIYKRKEGSLYDNGVVLCRADFAIMYSGDMILDNVTVYLTDVENVSYVWLMKYQLQSSAFQSLLSFAPRIAPSLMAKINLKTDAPQTTDKLALLRFENTISGETIRLRDIGIEVDDSSLVAASGDVDFTGFDTASSEIRIVNGRFSSNSYAGTVLCNAAIAPRISAPSAKIRYLDGSPIMVQHGVETVTLGTSETSAYVDIAFPFNMPDTNYSILLTASGGNANYRSFVQSENKLQSGFRAYVITDNKTAFTEDRTVLVSWAVIG